MRNKKILHWEVGYTENHHEFQNLISVNTAYRQAHLGKALKQSLSKSCSDRARGETLKPHVTLQGCGREYLILFCYGLLLSNQMRFCSTQNWESWYSAL